MKAPSSSNFFDTAGMFLSFLCLIHCIALPILFSLLPWMTPHLAHNESVHIAFALFILPIGLLALGTGYRKHGQRWILAWGTAGLICISTAVLAADQLGETVEHGLSVLGSVQLVLAHFCNLRAQKECCHH